jgi:hypothetical protein
LLPKYNHTIIVDVYVNHKTSNNRQTGKNRLAKSAVAGFSTKGFIQRFILDANFLPKIQSACNYRFDFKSKAVGGSYTSSDLLNLSQKNYNKFKFRGLFVQIR